MGTFLKHLRTINLCKTSEITVETGKLIHSMKTCMYTRIHIYVYILFISDQRIRNVSSYYQKAFPS